MARSYRQHAGYEIGHSSQTIGFCILLLLAVLFCGAEARAAFTIITSKTTEQTPCYWIEADTLELCSGAKLNLSEIQFIDDGTATPQELSIQKQAALACINKMEELLAQENGVPSKEQEVERMLEILAAAPDTGDQKGVRRQKKSIRKMLLELQREARQQQIRWQALRIPDQRLLQLRDIKVIQYSIRMQAYDEWLLYLKNGSPTRRAYAQEHDRRTVALEKKFMLKLKYAKDLTSQGGLDALFKKEHPLPQPFHIPVVPVQ